MRSKLFWLFWGPVWEMLALLPLALAGCSSGIAGNSGSSGQDGTVGINAQNGARIFVAYGCYECHGRAAQGASTGPRLGPDPISVEAMIHELRHPDEMPPYTERVVSDAGINDIHSFLASLPQPPNPGSIPLLSR